MVAYYSILGRQVGSHYLAIATLAATFGGAWASTAGGGAKKTTTPPINASSKDEENFIQEFLQSIEQEDKKAKIEGKQPH